jgi:HTH-type transcriptional regulator/antitoxin HigA
MSNVTAQRQNWTPNWAVHPGALLQEHLEARRLSQTEFARLAGLSPELVGAIISGNSPVTAETANRLEQTLVLKAYIWTGMQAVWDRIQAGTTTTLIPKLPD